jgi:hypothetical protein
VSYYFILLFLLCFATPVLITTSLNVFITSAVKNTHHEIISHHQVLTTMYHNCQEPFVNIANYPKKAIGF